MAYPAKTSRNNRIIKLRAKKNESGQPLLSYHMIAMQLRDEGHDPITAERVRQVILRHERKQGQSLKRIKKMTKDAGL